MLGKQKEAGLENEGDGGEQQEPFKSLKLNETHGRDGGGACEEGGEAGGERRKARGVPPGLLFGNPPLLETNSSAVGLVLMPK